LSYRKRPSKPWLVVRRKGVSPIRVVAGERFRTKKKAEKEAEEWNKAYEGSGIEFFSQKRRLAKKTLALMMESIVFFNVTFYFSRERFLE
jgi:hypothetical protein